MRYILIILCFPSLVFSQGIISGDDFIKNSLNFEISSGQPPKHKSINFPVIEKLDVRTETHEFLSSEQEYMMRITPSSITKREAQEAIYKHLIQKQSYEAEEYVCKLSYLAHQDWLGLYLMDDKLKQLNRLKAIYQKHDSLAQIEPAFSSYEIKDLLKHQIRLNDIEKQIKKQNALKNSILEFNNLSGMETDFSDFPTIEDLIQRIPLENAALKTFSEKELDYELREAQLEKNLEIEESKQFLDYFQVRYQGPRSDLIAERVSFGFGLNLPNSGNRKLKVKELEIEEQQIREEKRIRLEKQKDFARRQIQDIKRNYQILLQDSRSFEKEALRFKEFKSLVFENDNVDLESYFDIEERAIENQLEILDQKAKLYEMLLEYHYKTETLCIEPGKNLLAKK